MAERWRGEGEQHQGARPYQEDAWALKERADGSVLAVVSDGMGGHAGGAVASKAAVSAFMKAVEGGGSLAQGLAAANEAVRAAATGKPDLAGLGATLVGVIAKGSEVRWISVGDSPFFMVDAATIVRLNADHSMAPQIDALVERGIISPEEAAQHPARHTLREAVMGEPLSLIDEGRRDLPASARLLLCSDGIQTLSDKELLARARRPVKAMVEAVIAAKRKHQDNVTVVLLERKP
jgi:serine/threonine protein phosphatase PrpC